MAFGTYGFDNYIENLQKRFEFAMSNMETTTVSGKTLFECTNRPLVVQRQQEFIEKNFKDFKKNGPAKNYLSITPRYDPFVPETMGTVLLEEENRVGISDLVKNTGSILAGKFFLGRSITPASKLVAVETVVEDPAGKEAIQLSLNNVFSENAAVGRTDFEDVLPIGSYILIRNPLFKQQPGDNGGFKLHCNNPADFEFLSETFVKEKFPDWKLVTDVPAETKFPAYFWTRIPTTEEGRAKSFKYLGDKALAFGRDIDAVRWYNLSLEHSQDTKDKAELLVNKGAALIAMSCWNEALSCIDQALSLGVKNEKVLVRKGKCLIHLRRYDEAHAFLTENIEAGSKHLEKLLENVKEMIRLSSNHVELRDAIGKLLFSTSVKEDVIPDYQGDIAITNIPGKGRGVVATKRIPTGTIVLVNRALCFISQPLRTDLDSDTNLTIVSNMMVGKIANMIHMDREAGREFYQLTAGNEMGHIETTEMERNTFVDLVRIQRVLSMNQFGSSDYETDGTTWRGSWILPAFINHSCSESNCAYSVKSNVMIIRAVKDVEEGEELLLPYISGTESYEVRRKCHAAHEFKCDCRLCALEEKDQGKEVGEILHILKSTQGDFSKKRDKLFETLGLLRDVEKSMEKVPTELKLYLLNPGVLQFAVKLFSMGRMRDCKELLLKQFDIIEANPSMFDYGVKVGLNILRCMINEKNRAGAVLWVAKLKAFLLRQYGTVEIIKGSGDSTVEELKKAFGIDFFA